MISDTERREVATRLRNNASQDMDWMVPWAVFNDAEQHASDAVVRRLADLIDPSCDIDALLALADELSGDTLVVPAVYGTYAGGYVAACQDVARRIREALGLGERDAQ